MANSGKGTFQPDSDVHISYEDQQKINKFARLNAKVDDIKDELKVKQNDMKNLEEAVEELSLADESDKIPYLVGEVFICQSLENTLKSLDENKRRKQNEISELEAKCEELKSLMGELKAHLYGKFGSHINLENEED
ncbi:probable prefoldin subunit 4 [Vanessa tameamea]|uniref:Prefoldin subunit 4 n=1 Tax=Vanessa tameamea TaxID=334116 RepID=A0A8B8IU59_VANTA|nr:probable prefoldin subunit 4 [Vanessa tameamea]XP_047534594.1 probable prefoldin subunit 4 [Vanessa atalanta]